MGVLIPSGFGSARFVFKNDASAKEVGFTLGFSIDGDATVSRAAGMADLFGALGCPGNEDHMLTGWAWLGVDTLQRDDTDLYSFSYRATVAGATTGNPIPANCAVLVKKSSSLAGKKNRGRMYVPGIWPTEGSVDAGGNIDETQLGQMQDWYQNWFTGFEDDTVLKPVVLHDAAGTPAAIESFAVQGMIATQRRRLR